MILLGCKQDQIKPSSSDEVQSVAELSVFDPMEVTLGSQALEDGRSIWMETCAPCHLKGLGDAPVIGNHEAWAPRISKGKDTLYMHAIEGFYGDVGEMPTKGGNESLNDEQIKLAVDFVIYCSQ
jgi:cytochrome c5